MPLQVTGFVQDPHNINHVLAAAAVDQKMPGPLHNAQVAAGPIATEAQVVRPDAARQVRPLSRSGPLWIRRDVAKSLF